MTVAFSISETAERLSVPPGRPGHFTLTNQETCMMVRPLFILASLSVSSIADEHLYFSFFCTPTGTRHSHSFNGIRTQQPLSDSRRPASACQVQYPPVALPIHLAQQDHAELAIFFALLPHQPKQDVLLDSEGRAALRKWYPLCPRSLSVTSRQDKRRSINPGLSISLFKDAVWSPER
jgi:hypothetical protein